MKRSPFFGKWIALSLVSLSLLNCSGSSSNEFSMVASNKTVILLDTSTKSCQAIVTGATSSDVSPVYFTLPQINFYWSKIATHDLTIHWINFKLTSPGIGGNTFSTTLGGDSLLYTFYSNDYDPSSGPFEITISAGSSYTYADSSPANNSCAFRIGGIGFVDKKRDSYGSVTITAYATYVVNGELVPLTAQTTLDFFFKGSGI